MDFEIFKSTNQIFLFLLEKISPDKRVTLELIKASIMSISLQKHHVWEILRRVESMHFQ